MVEAAAEADDELMNKYLEGVDLTIDEIKRGLRVRTIKNEIVPMLCGTAFKNKGVQAMLDAVIDYMPSPVDIKPVEGETENGKPTSRKADDKEPFAALAFKIMTDPYVGQLTFIRVYSGVLNSGDTVFQHRCAVARNASVVCCRCMRISARKSRKSAPEISRRRWA